MGCRRHRLWSEQACLLTVGLVSSLGLLSLLRVMLEMCFIGNLMIFLPDVAVLAILTVYRPIVWFAVVTSYCAYPDHTSFVIAAVVVVVLLLPRLSLRNAFVSAVTAVSFGVTAWLGLTHNMSTNPVNGGEFA